MKGSPEIDDTLGFLEPKRTVRRMGRDVFNRRIRGKLGATLSFSPMLDISDERTRNAFTPLTWFDVQPFQEDDRRAARTVDIVDPLRRLNEACERAPSRESKTDKMPTRQDVGHFEKVLALRCVRPQP